jgi:hypothetical protein
MPDDRVTRIAALLHEAAETHHTVYRITDGDDPDWASWYADWLLELSELSDLLGAKPVRSHLVHALVQLDRDTRLLDRPIAGKTGTQADSGRAWGSRRTGSGAAQRGVASDQLAGRVRR